MGRGEERRVGKKKEWVGEKKEWVGEKNNDMRML